MIIDNFMYNNDSELLELRYHMLKDVVDCFVVSEANHTFTGIPKPFNAKNHVKQLGLDQDKFIFLEVDTSEHFLKEHEMDVDNSKKVGSPDKVSVYTRLRQQKDAIMSILDHFPNDATFIIGDVDEIPKPDAVKYMAKVCQEHPNNILKIPLVLLESSADRRVYDENNKPVEWRRSLAFCTKQQVKHKGPSILRAEWEPLGGTFIYHPIGITENGKLVEDLGWHFTWMGNKEKKIEKAKSCAHATALHLINNLSNETKELLKKDISDNIAQEYNYHHKPYDISLLPKEIFELPRVNAFLLPQKSYKVVDYFIYFNEKELLELRYHMLKDVVDLFVVSESNVTFTGKHKSFDVEKVIYELKLDRSKFKIIQNDLRDLHENSYNHVDLVSSQVAKDSNILAWTRERLQRDALMSIIHEFDNDCVFIISDIDEIVKPDSVPYLVNIAREYRHVLIKLPLVLLESRADKRMTRQDGSYVYWDRSMFLATKTQLKDITPNTLRGENQTVFPTVYITENGKRVEDLGWHFTWMGDQSRQAIKATNYGHAGNLNAVNTLSQSTVKTLENTLGKKIELQNSYNLIDYDLENLPKEIFNLPNVKKFLLPEESLHKKFDSQKLIDYVNDANNSIINFNLGFEYENFDQIAAAVSFYLRAAERTENVLLQYECFLRLAKCFQFQKNRNFTVTGLYNRAITLKPNRPEAYFLLSKHYFDINDHQNAYLYSTIGMNLFNNEIESLNTKVDYESILDLKMIQAKSGWYVGFYQQSKNNLRKIQFEIGENEYEKEKYHSQIEKFFTDVIKEKC